MSHHEIYHYNLPGGGGQDTANAYNYRLADSGGAGSLEEAHHELFKISPEVTAVHLAFTLISIFVIFFGIFSALIKERLFIGESIVATMVGIAVSEYGAGIFAPNDWGENINEVTLEITRAVIALSVFAIGVELPRAYVKRHWKSLAILLGPNMIAGWLISGAFVYLLVPGLHFLDALVIAASLTPTDPILASSVVGKGRFAQEHVPSHIRHVLQAESGCNDGAAFPFLYLAMFLVLREGESVGASIGWWILLVCLYQIVLGVIIGALVGIAARKLLKFSKRRSLIDRESMVAMYVALALFVTSATTLAGSDDLLAAFACGTAFAWDSWFLESIEDSNFSSILDLLANCSIFIYIGATIPFASFNDASITITWWRLLLLAIAIFLLRRLPAILLLHRWIPDVHSFREAMFVGWFGPIGVGALFISTLAQRRLPTPNFPPETHLDILSLSILPINYFLILGSSKLIHGLSIPVFTNTRKLSQRVQSFGRTFTANSTTEPSWLSRVKHIGDEKSDPEKASGENEKGGALGLGHNPTETGEETGEANSTNGSNNASGSDTAVDSPSGADDHPHGDAMKSTKDDQRDHAPEVWQEGDVLVREDSRGEHVKVEHPSQHEEVGPSGSRAASNSGSIRSISRHHHLQGIRDKISKEFDRPQPIRTESENRNIEAQQDETEDDDNPEQLYRKDKKSGKMKALTTKEMRDEELDRALRKEKHYCTNSNESEWHNGSQVVIERENGEVIVVQKKEAPEGPRRPNMLSRLSGRSMLGERKPALTTPMPEGSAPERPAPTAQPSFRQRLFAKPAKPNVDPTDQIAEEPSQEPEAESYFESGRPDRSIRFA